MGQDVLICRCEGVYLSDIKRAIQNGASVIPGIKMRTRVGMGHCQGRLCQQALKNILLSERGSLKKHHFQTSQSPVRPTLLEDF